MPFPSYGMLDISSALSTESLSSLARIMLPSAQIIPLVDEPELMHRLWLSSWVSDDVVV